MELLDQLLLLFGLLTKLVNFGRHFGTQGGNVPLDESVHAVDRPIPLLQFICIVDHWRYSVQEDVFLNGHLLLILLSEAESVLPEQLQLGLRGKDNFILHDSLKSVSHDGNQHIEHRDLSEEGRQDEKDDTDGGLWSPGETLGFVAIQRLHVLPKNGIKDGDASNLAHYSVVFAPIEVEEHHREPKHHQGQQEKDQEKLDVFDGLLDEKNVEGRLLKHAKPVVSFQQECSRKESSKHSLSVIPKPQWSNQVGKDEDREECQMHQVCKVPKVEPVGPPASTVDELAYFLHALVHPEEHREDAKGHDCGPRVLSFLHFRVWVKRHKQECHGEEKIDGEWNDKVPEEAPKVLIPELDEEIGD